MSRLASPRTLPSPYLVTTPLEVANWSNISPAVGLWPSANRAIYVPFRLRSTQRIKTVSIWCTIGAGNFDLGLYNSLGTGLLASLGSTALTAAAINTWTPANPILIEAGVRYYLGMSCSTATSSFARMQPSLLSLRAGGLAQQATAHPLPNPAVPAQIVSLQTPIFALAFV